MIDYEPSPQVDAMKQSIRDFVDRELIPAESEVERTGEVPTALIDMMRELGLFGMRIPAEYGGLGLDMVSYCLVSEELTRSHSAFRALIQVNNGIGSKCLVLVGTEEQKQRFLPELASGRKIAAFALTEPEAGSDAANIRTTARLDGDCYVLDGLKHFITNGPAADYVTVVALTDPPKRAKGMSIFIVERGTPGYEVARVQETMGPRGYHQAELSFDGCRVPKENLVGEPGSGFKTALRALNEGRISMAVASIGAARRLLDEATAYAKARVQFGKPIAEQQAIQFMLADMATELFASRAMTLEAAWRCERAPRINQYSSMAKLFASEAVGRIADRAVQIFGGMGYMKELPIERIYREVRLHRIVEGTSEIQRLIIARELLKD